MVAERREPVLDETPARSHHEGVGLLADLPILIVDLQSTGASPAYGSVLELGWGVVRASRPELDRAEAHWITLPAGVAPSRRVRQITGWEPTAAAGALEPREAWSRLREAAANASSAPTAIHYARFELPFLRAWSAEYEADVAFPLDAVCLHDVARRLHPELPRQSLRALSGFLGHGLDLERRSLGHVEATAFVWRALCADLSARGVVTWEDLRAFLGERAPVVARPKKPRYPIAPERYRSLPDAPGVYRFLRKNGDVLYVGKAASLKKRAATHFIGRASTDQSPEMLTQVSDIAITVVASALEAALLENETIKALRPPYNVQLVTGDLRVFYASRDFRASASVPDETHALGPLASEGALRPLGALVALVSGEAPTALLRANAVGVSDLWTPDETVFSAGWDELTRRHPELSLATGLDARTRILRLARRILAKSRVPDETEVDAAKPDGWDADRVARHVERAAAQAFQSYRRARWLARLHDADVVVREPESARVRLLEVRGGELASARDVAPDETDPPGTRPFERARAPRFDRAIYDRLRILTTELKRIARDGGDVAIAFRAGRRVRPDLLAGVLRVV